MLHCQGQTTENQTMTLAWESNQGCLLNMLSFTRNTKDLPKILLLAQLFTLHDSVLIDNKGYNRRAF